MRRLRTLIGGATPTPYRVLVTGSRDWDDIDTIAAAIEQTLIDSGGRPVLVVHGACPSGADWHADHYARWLRGRGCSVDVEPHPANWSLNGKAAGFIRNQLMVNLGADICLAFIKNGSRGASHTARLAEEAGIKTRRWTA
ncbi:SLOG family protein [Streptomyces sp. NPDC056437]|uniref:SLOG family protein n=1 Tax=Streptomyces sp. NPDC056437 TaxID=3345816 RepID=UPI0036B81396